MARLILKSPYLKPGGKKSPGGYLKYIATREGVEMAEDTSRHLPATAEQQKQIAKLLKQHRDCKDTHEYQDYLANPTRGNADAFISSIMELHGDAPQRDVYPRYIDERPGSNGLFTDEGVPIVLSQVQKEMNEHPGNIWTHIISLRWEDAERLGYNSPDAWMYLLRSQRNMIAQQMKISPENFRWYAAFHNAGHHPHVHMMAYSIDPKEAYLTKKGIETIKSNLAQEIFRQDLLQIYQQQTQRRDELRQQSRKQLHEIANQINQGSIRDPELEQMLIQLSDRLANTKGKKQYGYLKPADKQLVDTIVSKLANEPRIQQLYSLWYDLKEDVLRTYTNKMPDRVPLEQNKEFKAIRNAVIQAALKITIPPPSHLSEPCLPRVDFVDDGTEVYQQAAKSLLDPAVTPSPEVAQFFHDAAIQGSVDAVYGMGKVYQETDTKKAVGFFELAAEQGNTYAEYQLGKMYCFGEGIPQNLEVGVSWLQSAADHGNSHAAPLLQYVQEQTQVVALQGAFGLLKNLARMIRSEGEQEYHYKHRVESKLMQQIREKKQALGIRSKQEEQGIRMQ